MKTPQTPVEKLWTVKETAERTGFSEWFVYKEIARGRLRCVRLGTNRRTIRIAPADVENYLSEGRTGPASSLEVNDE